MGVLAETAFQYAVYGYIDNKALFDLEYGVH